MQRIERYGVIALLLLLVTVLAVSMWGEDTIDAKDSKTHTLASVTPEKRVTNANRGSAVKSVRPQGNYGPKSQLTETPPLTVDPRPQTVRVKPNVSGSTPSAKHSGARGNNRGRRNTRPSSQTTNNREFAIGDSNRRKQANQIQPGSDISVRPNKPIRTGSALAVKPNIKPAVQPAVQPVSSRALSDATTLRKKAATWTVKSGETLSEIAELALGSSKLWPAIVEANPSVDPNRLSVGTKLVLPTGAKVAAAKPVAAPAAEASKTPVAPAGTYTVRSGDVLSVIAQRELGSSKRWPEIVALNPGLDANRLNVGARLVMPTGVAARSSSANSSNRVAAVRPKKSSAKRNRVR